MNQVLTQNLSALAWMIGAALATYPLASVALRPPTQKIPRDKGGNH